MKKLSTRTLGELKLIAREQGIDAEGLRKAEIVEAIQSSGGQVITSMNTAPSHTDPSASTNDNGIFISPQPEKVKTEMRPEPKPYEDANKVAVYASRNLNWAGVGKLEKGYNFVKREAADKWLTLKAVRQASPEEVASHYGI